MTHEPNPELFGLRPDHSRLNRRRVRAAAGSALFLVVAPGTTAILVPYLLTGYERGSAWPPAQIAGAALTLAGGAVLLSAFARFALEGLGTPAPVAPTERLVVRGLYRYVRNPMYLAVTATILGQWLLLGRPVLLAWAGVFLLTTYAFVRGYEEPTLTGLYGAEYERYRATVPGWWPRRPTAGRARTGPRGS
jgi:protein-S-isoprenylcysteine O-methyltransferase Ste14